MEDIEIFETNLVIDESGIYLDVSHHPVVEDMIKHLTFNFSQN